MVLTAQRTARARLVGPLATLLAVAAAWATVALLRPGDSGPTPCPLRNTTGVDCPFCGATRAAASLAHGELTAALDHNAFFVLAILPTAIVTWLVWTVRAWRGQPGPAITNRAMWIGLGVTAVWWVVRLAVPWLGSAAA